MFTRIIILFIALITAAACAPSPGQEVAVGNQSFADGDYADASAAYQAAVDLAPAQAEPLYNLANARYRQGVYTETHQILPQVASLGSQELAGQSYFNQGNAYFQLNDWEAAVESYKQSLRINPDDLEAKYNLELAMRNLDQPEQQDQQQDQEQEENEENQKEQEQEQEQDQDQEGQGDQNEPQENNQENGDQPQEDQQDESEDSSGDEQEQEESPEEPQEQSADGSESQQPQEDQQQNAQPQEGLTPEQARQLLRAVGQNTETLQEQMQLVLPHDGPPPEKDW